MTPTTVQVHNHLFRRFLAQETIHRRIAELGEKIRSDYNDKNIVYVIVLKGAMMFAMDLIRSAAVPCRIEVVSASSYGEEMNSSGVVSFNLSLPPDSLRGKHVVLVEDIVDTGRTIVALQHELRKFSPESIRIATLLFKSGVFSENIAIDYIGFDIAPEFVVGYGMDYAEAGRYLSDIYVLDNGASANVQASFGTEEPEKSM